MNIRRISRLLKILQFLSCGGGYNADGLAMECGVSRRTAFRDIESLRAAGLPVEYDADRDCYSLGNTYYLPPVNFTAAEAVSLVTLALELGRAERLPFFESARSAAGKLERSLPTLLRDQLRRTTSAIHIEPTPVNSLKGKRGIYQQIIDAMDRRQVVRIEYASLVDTRRISIKLRPYRLIFRRHSWYVIGRSSVHSDIRPFNLSRIATLDFIDEQYAVPKGFCVEKYLRNAWHLTPETGDDQQVVVRFTSLVAQNVAEVRWHKTQTLQYEDDGSLVFRAQVSGLNEIVWWVLSFGDQAEVIQPERLRCFVAQRARNMVTNYDKDSRP